MNPDESTQDIEAKVIEALTNQDGIAYVTLYGEHGFEITDPQLYDSGLAQMKTDSDELLRLEEISRISNYQKFLKEAGHLSENRFEQADEKRKVLQKYFPKFGPEDIQDISNYSDPKIGRLFNDFYKNAKKQLRE